MKNHLEDLRRVMLFILSGGLVAATTLVPSMLMAAFLAEDPTLEGKQRRHPVGAFTAN